MARVGMQNTTTLDPRLLMSRMTEGEKRGGQKEKGGEDRGKELSDEAAWRTILVSVVVVCEGWV